MAPLSAEEQEAIVKHILTAQKKKDYIAVLKMDPPILLDGEPHWYAAEADINRHFRQMSLQVHPDKNSSAAAGIAFRALATAQEALGDPLKRRDNVMQYKSALIAEQRQKTLELRRQWSQKKKANTCTEDFKSFQGMRARAAMPTVVTQRDSASKAATNPPPSREGSHPQVQDA